MKRLFMLIPLALPIAALTMNRTTPKTSQSPEEAIWKLEEAYWKNHTDANHAAILEAYHEDFLGWPDSHPVRNAKQICLNIYGRISRNLQNFNRQ